MTEINLDVCGIIDTIAQRVSDTLPCLPLPVETTPITALNKVETVECVLDEEDICNRILKYKLCHDFSTLPKPLFFYKRFPEYYSIEVGGVSYEKFIELIEGADEYKKCETTEERRKIMRNKLVKMLCYHYKIKGYLPEYEEKYWDGTRYLEFNQKAHIAKQYTKYSKTELTQN